MACSVFSPRRRNAVTPLVALAGVYLTPYAINISPRLVQIEPIGINIAPVSIDVGPVLIGVTPSGTNIGLTHIAVRNLLVVQPAAARCYKTS